MATLHEDELHCDVATVRRLVAAARPELAHLRVTDFGASGSSNRLFALGDDLLVRVPRRRGGGDAIRKEARWTPVIAAAIPTPVPEVMTLGEPSTTYPESWSVVRRLDGQRPVAGTGGAALGGQLGAMVRAWGAAEVPLEALGEADLRWYRGDPLAAFDAPFRHWLRRCRSMPQLDLDLDRAERIWEQATALPVDPAAEPRWLHADLLAENLLVDGDRLAGVVDLGALTLGDPAADLMVAWEVLDADGRAAFRESVAVDEATWLRGRAWAIAVALMTFPYYWDSMPERCADRLVMARSALGRSVD